jgi:hypothetical protein
MKADLFPHQPTLGQQIACVEREIRMRERVYPGWVSGGRMSQAKADHEIAAMKAVLTTLQSINTKET